MSRNMWMVRAGRGAAYIDRFIEESVVALGWREANSAKEFQRMGDYYRYLLTVYPDWKQRRVSISAGQIYRFYNEVAIDDWVLSYVPPDRQYLVGKVSSEPRHLSDDEDFGHVRRTEWQGKVERDRLSVSARNTLGSIATFFTVGDDVKAEIISLLDSPSEDTSKPTVDDESAAQSEEQEMLFDDLQARSMEFLEDMIVRLDWEDMQELVAGLLRAMGYKTLVSPSGPDRGKDVIASPDGFGFEDPRIVVEVKHRKGSMGAPDIRSFLGGRHPADKGLYVSTGGFTKEAYYEAERANIRLTLMNLSDISAALIHHYEKLDLSIQNLVPMRRLYWPIGE